MPHVVRSLGSLDSTLGTYAAGHSSGHSRFVLVGRVDSPHQEVAVGELEPDGRVDRHLHAFEQALYVLSGSVALEVAGRREELVADDFVWIEFGVPHSLENTGSDPVRWLEVSAPAPGSPRLEDTVFGGEAAAQPEVAYRRGRFDVSSMPEPSETLGLAGASGASSANVGGAAVELLVNQEFGASQLNLMALRYVPGGGIEDHDHAFEEAFLFLEGEIEVVLDGQPYTLRGGDFFWSGVGGTHSLHNRSDRPVRWLESQVPQPPPRHQFRYGGDWERLVGAG